MTEKLWFSQSIEGLFVHGIGGAMTPTLRAQLLELGIDLQKLQPAYEDAVVSRAIRLSGAVLYPDKPEQEALREMGKLFLLGFSKTFMWKALVQFMKVIGVRRSLQRMQRNFRAGGTYIETRFTFWARVRARFGSTT